MKPALHMSIAIVALAMSATPSRAQAIIGNLDSPRPRQTVGTDALFQGWTLSCYTAQQPAAVEVWFQGAPEANGYRPITVATATGIWRFTASGAWEQVSAQAGVEIAWRGERPDVAAAIAPYCPITSNRWGYALRLTVPLPPGPTPIALRFFDPSISPVVHDQRTDVVVVP